VRREAAPSPSRRLAALAAVGGDPDHWSWDCRLAAAGPFVLAATFFLFGLALPPVILRSLPGARDLVVEGLQAFIEPRALSVPRVALQPSIEAPWNTPLTHP
jgi:hypothetical protein